MKVIECIPLQEPEDYTIDELIGSCLNALRDNNQTAIALYNHFGHDSSLRASAKLPFFVPDPIASSGSSPSICPIFSIVPNDSLRSIGAIGTIGSIGLIGLIGLIGSIGPIGSGRAGKASPAGRTSIPGITGNLSPSIVAEGSFF